MEDLDVSIYVLSYVKCKNQCLVDLKKTLQHLNDYFKNIKILMIALWKIKIFQHRVACPVRAKEAGCIVPRGNNRKSLPFIQILYPSSHYLSIINKSQVLRWVKSPASDPSLLTGPHCCFLLLISFIYSQLYPGCRNLGHRRL